MKISVFLILLSFTVFIFNLDITYAEDATGEANSVREIVKEKVEAARSNPKAYIGSVTDKTENTVQIQNDSGEIQLISIDPETASFAKIDTKTTTATYDDVAIGDYIIAMGFTNGNGVLETKRVVITSKPEELKREIFLGNITKIDNKEVTLKINEEELTLKFPKSWKGPEIKELEENIEIIVVGENNDNNVTVRTIHIASDASPTPQEE